MGLLKGNRRKKELALKTLSGLGLLVLAFGIVVFWKMLGLNEFVETIEWKAYDLRMQLGLPGKTHEPSPNIAIIAFDDQTLYGYEHRYGTWPWSRSVHASMIRFLNKAGVKLMAYDLMFNANRLADSAADKELIETFIKTPNVFFGMNLDNNQFQAFEKSTFKKEPSVTLLQSVAIPFHSERPKNSKQLGTDAVGFPLYEGSMFQGFRPLMEGVYKAGNRIYILNHTRSQDGVSRSNPLLFQLKDKKTGQLSFYPQMGIRLLEFLIQQDYREKKLPPPKVTYTLKADNTLVFSGHSVPLAPNGVFFVNWFTQNYLHKQVKARLEGYVQPALQKALQQSQANPKNLTVLKQVALLQQEEQLAKHFLLQTTTPSPYPIIPAWHVVQAMLHQQEGHLTTEDKQLITQLKGKILFIGSTSVAGYDIKTSPVARNVPGVLQQAVIFDNLYQNKGYIVRLSPWFNGFITLFLGVTTALVITLFRSAIISSVVTLAGMSSFIGLNLLLFSHYFLWLDLTFPLLIQLITGLFTYLIKYFLRDKDYEKTYQLATTDGLTGLHNHRYFQEFIHTALLKAQRSQGVVSLVLVDIDFFKKFNDTHGHQAGDEVLRLVAQKLKGSVRATDLVARYGGEEMAVVLPNTDAATALQIGEKLVKQIGLNPYPIAEGVQKHVTISVGVATFPIHGSTVTELIEFSDKGLYRAKEAGRNRVGDQFDTEDKLSPVELPPLHFSSPVTAASVAKQPVEPAKPAISASSASPLQQPVTLFAKPVVPLGPVALQNPVPVGFPPVSSSTASPSPQAPSPVAFPPPLPIAPPSAPIGAPSPVAYPSNPPNTLTASAPSAPPAAEAPEVLTVKPLDRLKKLSQPVNQADSQKMFNPLPGLQDDL